MTAFFRQVSGPAGSPLGSSFDTSTARSHLLRGRYEVELSAEQFKLTRSSVRELVLCRSYPFVIFLSAANEFSCGWTLTFHSTTDGSWTTPVFARPCRPSSMPCVTARA